MMDETDATVATQHPPIEKAATKSEDQGLLLKAGEGKAAGGGNNSTRNGLNAKKIVLAAGAFALIILVIVLAVALTGGDDSVKTEPPVSMDFTTGVSLITYYNINATISQRLARSVLTMEVANALDCTSIHGVTLQLPKTARVASVRTMADDGCTTRGEVQPLEDARETFAENAAAGLPGAYVEAEARDGTTYSLQVALPPMGTTVVELVTEELLRQKVGEVEYQLPLVPNEQVDQLSLEITILDDNNVKIDDIFVVNGTTISSVKGPSFELDLGSDLQVGTVVSPYKLEIPDAREYDLPRILRGEYKPDALPDKGVLYRDGGCFEYTFLPGSLVEPKAKNIFFLLDISGYGNEEFLRHAKLALKDSIDLLTPKDTLTIQVFDERGTADLWGSTKATELEKDQAKNFLDELKPGWGSTNLHEALLEGLLRSKRDAEEDLNHGVVTLMVVLSNSWATAGATNRTKIASDVWKLNEEGHVKIFSLGSPSADLQLLDSIAIMNGGVTTSLDHGTIDYKTQMTSFFESEFGNILLSDVEVRFEAETGAKIYGETPRSFPVLASGTEVVVRGLVDHTSSQETRTLQAVTTAISPAGSETWTTLAVDDPFVLSLGEFNSRCFQSYAHSRITQLLQLRDVALLLGDGVVEPIIALNKPCDRKKTSFADCIKAEALSLALEAQVVVAGLSGLVTIDDEELCVAVEEEEAEICLDGTNKGDYDWEQHTSGGSTHSDSGEIMGVRESAPASDYYEYSSSSSFGKAILVALLVQAVTAFVMLSDSFVWFF